MTAVLAAPAPEAPLVDRDCFGVYVHVPFCSSRSRTMSMWSSPRKPQRNPNPSAVDDSGS